MTKTEIKSLHLSKTAFKTRSFHFKKKPNELKQIRIAFAISRRHGNAVLRNRFKRRLRHLINTTCVTNQGFDFMCLARRSLKHVTHSEWHEERLKIKNWCETL